MPRRSRTVTIKGHDNIAAFLSLQGERESPQPKTNEEVIMEWAMRVHLAVVSQDTGRILSTMRAFKAEDIK